MNQDEPIIDSAMSREEALAGLEIPPEIARTLIVVTVPYISFDEKLHQGQLVVHEDLADDVMKIFTELYRQRYPIEKIIPIAAYGWNDEDSMQDNNTSAFNYRIIYGTNTLSNHSYGRAIDINPWINPYYARDGSIFPQGAEYDPTNPRSITADKPIVALFKSYGWHWGGDFDDRKDWQHFAKV